MLTIGVSTNVYSMMTPIISMTTSYTIMLHPLNPQSHCTELHYSWRSFKTNDCSSNTSSFNITLGDFGWSGSLWSDDDLHRKLAPTELRAFITIYYLEGAERESKLTRVMLFFSLLIFLLCYICLCLLLFSRRSGFLSNTPEISPTQQRS